MNDLEPRLQNCFAAVFPDLTPAEIPAASVTSVASWESLTGVMLVSVIEEEFGIQIPPEDLDGFVSYELILDYLREQVPDAA
jgi:acyl carrier protein